MSFDYHVDRQETAFDARLKKVKLDLPTADDAAFENASAEQIKDLFNKAARSEQEKLDSIRSQQDGNTFCELFPEYMDTGKNARHLRAHCTALGIAYPTLADLETAYYALRSVNLLEINQQELARQEAKGTKERADEIRRTAFDEAEAYTMPLEEVRRRAGGSGGGWY